MDRTKEHLGTADSAVILMRRQLMRIARQLQQGIEPYSANHGEVYRVRALDEVDATADLGALITRYENEMLRAVTR
jgi:hypothetical protein